MVLKTKILNIIPTGLRQQLQQSDKRSKDAIKNIIISLIVKVANIISTLLVVPLTINYVNPTQYGIWLSLSTIIGWVAFFDLGLGNGFRNKFAEAKAKCDFELARQYLSTTYFTITVIVLLLYSGVLIANCFIDWATLLNVDQSYREELHRIFAIVCGFMCFNMIANIFSTLLTADQKPGIAAIIQALGQYIALFVIFILTKISTGSLTNLAIYYSGVPCITMFVASIIVFKFTSYHKYRPGLKYVRRHLIKSITGIGFQFFFIYLCMILVFQLVNIIISRELGPLSVTEYNVASKYFNVLYMIINIIITPFWSAFTEAYTKHETKWMESVISKLEKMFLIAIPIGIIMLITAPFFYRIWIGNSVNISFGLSACMLILSLARTIGNIYMYLINGIGTIRIQLITYVVFAIISWPALTYSCRLFGICGIIIAPTLVYLAHAVVIKIQITKHINGNASGIWSK